MGGMKNIDTSRWKFPKADKTPVIPSLNHLTPSNQKREQEAKKVERMLEEVKSREFIKSLATCTNSETVAKLANVLNIQLPDESPVLGLVSDQHSEPSSKTNLATSEDSTNLTKSNETEDLGVDHNTYWKFLRHIEKAEKEKKQSDPETIAYKLAEERMNKIAEEFCRWTSCLVLPEDSKQNNDISADDDKQDEMIMQPEKLRELFRIDLCQPTLCPYIPYIIREAREMPQQAHEKRKSHKIVPADEMTKEKRWKMKQVYYIPPNKWFSHEDKNAETEFTLDEEEFIKSFGFKKFMQFLEERGEEPPKIFENLKKRHKEKVKRIKEEQKAISRQRKVK